MAVSLEDWEERLERHFASLARTRADSGFPIFALEHGLSQEEFDHIAPALRPLLKHRRTLPCWLLWVVYATELGYGYAGDEYWSSFQEQTPEWEYQDRDRIKPWFRKFHQSYRGVVPSGQWAEHFRIIAWPITHAILPRYLQRQFARALYDLRFRLASLTALEPRRIGRLLALNEHYGSARFREFLQQEELTGRIVLALLGTKPPEGQEPIYPPTLRRIIADLETVRSSREWLNEARHVVADRFRGIGQGLAPSVADSPVDYRSRPGLNTAGLNLRPNLLLRHSGGGTWSVFLEVPSFRGIAALNPDIRMFLQGTRCRLNGANDTKPTGWLLSGRRKGALRSWPDPEKPFIQFERTHPTIDHLLESGCRPSQGPVWLFRIANDGTARQVIGRNVRPGQDYIVATTAGLPPTRDGVNPCKLDCHGVKSFRLTIPPYVSADLTGWLQGMALQVARTIRVWPAGLPGRGWDGDGSSEWLTTEAPCFGIVHDHPLESYAIRLNDGTETSVHVDGTGSPAFVRLPPLPVGTHFLTVTARRHPTLEAIAVSPPAEGFAQLTVREPEPWTPGVASHPGLVITVDPNEPDLDTVWRNEISLSVNGPESHAVAFTISLESSEGQEILSEPVGAAVDLPVSPDVWRRIFAQFLTSEAHAWSYLEATRGTLTVDGETLGRFSLKFEHDARPVRLVMRRHDGDIVLRLVDDAGSGKTKVHFYSMARPLKAVPLPPESAMSGVVVAPPGGLFVAKHGDRADAVAVSTGLKKEGRLQDLGVRPRFSELSREPLALAANLRLLTRWHDARLSGFLANARHEQVINGFLAAVYRVICGQNWAEEESRFRMNPRSPRAIEALKRRVARYPSFAASLHQNQSRMSSNIAQGAHWFAQVAASYKVCNDIELCVFALRLASQPHRFTDVSVEELVTLVTRIATNPTILRGARLLALLSVSQSDDLPIALLPRWQW